MKLSAFLLLLSLFSCKDGTSSNDSMPSATEPSPLPSETIPTPETPLPQNPDTPSDEPAAPLVYWEHNVKFVNFSAAQKAKVEKALALMKLVIEGDEFKSRVLSHTYKGKKTFVDNGGFTNQQIYDKILAGAETWNKEVDEEMDIELELYYALSSTVGYTYPDSKRIWMNTRFFTPYTAAEVSHNIMHEWMHKLGFTHSSSSNAARPYSVPYAVGNLMGELAEKLDR